MRICYITLSSNNTQSIKNLIQKINSIVKTIQKSTNNKNKKIRVSILKSPHVNKTAQEQFESLKFSKKIVIQTSKISSILTHVKTLNQTVSSDVLIKILYKNSDISSDKNFNYFSKKNTLYENNFLNFNNFHEKVVEDKKNIYKKINKILLKTIINIKKFSN